MILLGSTCTWKIVYVGAKMVTHINTRLLEGIPHSKGARAHLAPLGVTWLPSMSLICSNTLPSESILWWQVSWLINTPEWKYKDPWSHHPTVDDQIHKNAHTHALHHLEGHHIEDGGPSPQWGTGRCPHPIA